jgi:hypothetical protein
MHAKRKTQNEKGQEEDRRVLDVIAPITFMISVASLRRGFNNFPETSSESINNRNQYRVSRASFNAIVILQAN